MLDAVVLEYNTEREEGIVEAINAPCRRYRVFFSINKGQYETTYSTSEYKCDENYHQQQQQQQHQQQQEQEGQKKQSRLNYVGHLLNSTPIGRCVTIHPVDEMDTMFVNRNSYLPLARLVHMHEASSLTSKSMLPGIITRVSSRFVFIFCSFLPYEAVATRDMFSTGRILPVENTPFSPFSSTSSTSHFFTEDEEKYWIGRSVHFALHPMSYLVMEAFFTNEQKTFKEVEGEGEGEEEHNQQEYILVQKNAVRNKTKNSAGGGDSGNNNNNNNSGGSCSGIWGSSCNSSQRIFHEGIGTEVACVKHINVEEFCNTQLGAWSIIGTDPCYFFQPDLSLQFLYGTTVLSRNTLPPLMQQKSSFTIQLWCFWILAEADISLSVYDEDERDVTHIVLNIEKDKICELSPITLDNLQSRVVLSFTAQIKTFKMQDTVCELTFVLRAVLGTRETRLASKPVFIRRGRAGLSTPRTQSTQSESTTTLTQTQSTTQSTLTQSTQSSTTNTNTTTTTNTNTTRTTTIGIGIGPRDVLSQKFWTTDVLGPQDSIVGGLTDPGRSNQLFAEADRYDALPLVEREVIVIDPQDGRLQTIAALARRALLGIVDTVVRVQTLVWLVVSAFGGDSGVLQAEDKLTELRLRRAGEARKRRRGESQSEESANVVRLGDIHHGVCRHRALLFKYLCDVVQMPCYLLRGEHQGTCDENNDNSSNNEAERHSWNIVPLEGRRHLLVDTTLSPHKLHMWPVSGYKAPPIDLNTSWSHSHYMILHRSAAKIQLLEECGRGATAVVRRGVLGGGLTCVVKVPRRNSDLDSLIREYEVLRRFRSTPYVVRCLGWSGGVVMEYLPTNLLSFMNHLIIREKRMSLSQQKEILFCILSALKEVHTRGYVHRDIKAENVLLVVIRCNTCHSLGTVCHLCDVRAKLGDFADSVMVHSNTQIHKASPRIGTPPYVAPELEAEMPFSFAADIWSCGILAIEMAQMRLPVINIRSKTLKREVDNGGNNNNTNNNMISGAVFTNVDGRQLGPVYVPQLPQTPRPPKWQQEFVDGALRVNWRERSTATMLLEVLCKAAC